jgi:hypothetical protein
MISYDDILAWVRRFAAVVTENKSYLTDLDSASGDADHGINMDRGVTAVVGKLTASPAPTSGGPQDRRHHPRLDGRAPAACPLQGCSSA